MEIKKSDRAQLEDKRVTFFLLGLLIAFTLLFVGLQYSRNPQGDDDWAENFEDLSQDMEMSTPPDQKDMVSAEAMAKAPASQAITQEVKPTEQQMVKKTPEKISTTTSSLVIGDGSGVVEGADVKEAAPETAVDPADTQAEAPIKFTVVQKIPEFPGGWSAFMQEPEVSEGGAEQQGTGHGGGNLHREQGWKHRQYQGKYLGGCCP